MTLGKSRIAQRVKMRKYVADLEDRAVLQIIPRLDAGGAERTTLDIAKSLISADAKSFVACEGGRLVPELVFKWDQFYSIPRRDKKPSAHHLEAVSSLRNSFESIISQSFMRARGRQLGRLGLHQKSRIFHLSQPIMAVTRGRIFSKFSITLIMARGDVVIANSHYTASLIQKMHPFAGNRIRVIHRGTDMTEFSPASVSVDRQRALRACVAQMTNA